MIAGKRRLSHVELFSGDGLSRVEVDTSGLVHGESPGLHYGCANVADCFHRMRSPFFVGQGVSNKYLKMTEVEGTKLRPINSLADVLLVTIGFLLESLFRPVRKSDTIEPTAIRAL